MNENQERQTDGEPREGQTEDQPAQDESPPTGSRLETQLQRAMADLANLRRRQARDLADARQRAIEVMAHELLPVLDNFDLALGATQSQPDQSDAASIVEGLKMVRSMLEGVLERHGLTEIVAEGEKFDPNLHEAVGLDHESDVEPGLITSVVLRGYRMNDKVVRPTRVVVRGEPNGDGD